MGLRRPAPAATAGGGAVTVDPADSVDTADSADTADLAGGGGPGASGAPPTLTLRQNCYGVMMMVMVMMVQLRSAVNNWTQLLDPHSSCRLCSDLAHATGLHLSCARSIAVIRFYYVMDSPAHEVYV